jgi:spore coat polysaccharide biosynthesis predicted glycosyltransferase SpsG
VNSPKIILFADAGEGVGTGHIFRLLPIFIRLREMQVATEMWVPLPQESLLALGLTDMKPVKQELLISALIESEPTLVVIDTYRQRDKLLQVLDKQNCSVALFDDHFDVKRKVKLIVNSSPSVTSDDYDSALADDFFLGPAYASISNTFLLERSRYQVSGTISRILVALGGMDVARNLPALLNVLVTWIRHPAEICVLTTQPIMMVFPDHINLSQVWLDQDTLSQRMPEFDLAILAGGTMLWQTACVGLPTISWPQTAQQKGHAAAWGSMGTLIVINNLNALSDALVQLQSQVRRKELSLAGSNLIDGKGASRIAEYLYSITRNGNAHSIH